MPLDYVRHHLYFLLKQHLLTVKSKQGQFLCNIQMNNQIPSLDLKLYTNLIVKIC